MHRLKNLSVRLASREILALLGVLMVGHACLAASKPAGGTLFFTGDILLSREVAHEIEARRGASPWVALGGVFKGAGLVMGNLEGSVGDPSHCLVTGELCFADPPKYLTFLKQAGFTAIGIANNHSGDLGAIGRRDTRRALDDAGLTGIGAQQSPAFLRLGDKTLAIVALNLVPARDGGVEAVPSWQVAQKLRLAKGLADWVVVFVHWGKELADWVVPAQRAQARWLVGHGASLIIGAHPHVVQAPECVDGRPVFFSLGNHVFDQKYLETKQGLIAECHIVGSRLRCGALETATPRGSSFPRLVGPILTPALRGCDVPAAGGLAVGDFRIKAWTPDGVVTTGPVVLAGTSGVTHWRTVPRSLLSAEAGRLVTGKPPMVLTIERHVSHIDDEDGPRPYVYDVGPNGLIARWRGSALAWPLLDATLLGVAAGGEELCALHRGDSFILLDPDRATVPRVEVYRWNGFGFSGVEDSGQSALCYRRFFEGALP